MAKGWLHTWLQAMRSTGLDHFENGITMTLDEPNEINQEMVEFRAPSKSEMNRWLVTLNLHSFTGGNPSASAAGTLLMGSDAVGVRRTGGQVSGKPVVEVGVSKELMAGWLSLKKDKAGSKKKRYCRLISETEADGTGNVLQRATLYAMAKLDDPVGSYERIEVRRGRTRTRTRTKPRTRTRTPNPNPSLSPILERGTPGHPPLVLSL